VVYKNHVHLSTIVPHLYLALPLGVTLLELHRDLWHRQARFPVLSCGVVLRDPTFSRFVTVPAYDGRTDRRIHDDSIYRASIVID